MGEMLSAVSKNLTAGIPKLFDPAGRIANVLTYRGPDAMSRVSAMDRVVVLLRPWRFEPRSWLLHTVVGHGDVHR